MADQLAEYESQLSEINQLLEDSPDDEGLLKLKDDLVELIQLTKEEEPEPASATSDVNAQESTPAAPEVSPVTVGVPGSISSTDGRSVEYQSGLLQTDTADISNLTASASIINNTLVPNDDNPMTTTATTTAVAVVAPAAPVAVVAVSAVSAVTTETTINETMEPTKPTSASTSTTTSTTKQTKSKKQKSEKILKSTFEIPQHLLPLPSDTEAERTKKRRNIKALKSKFRSKKKTAETEVKQRSWQDFAKKKKKKGNVNLNSSIFATAEGVGKVGVVRGSSQMDGVSSGSGGSSKRSRHTFA